MSKHLKHLKLFEKHSQYETFIDGGDGEVTLPIVSLCLKNSHLHYDPYVAPEPQEPQPISILGIITDLSDKIDIFMDGANIVNFPTSSKRAGIMVNISEKFPAVPSEHISHIDKSDSPQGTDSPEGQFIQNNVLNKYTEISATDVKAFIARITSTNKVTHLSAGVARPRDTKSYRENFDWVWTSGPATRVFHLTSLDAYSSSNTYYLVGNFKNHIGTEKSFTEVPVYREDFDVIIVPNTWNLTTILPVTIFQKHFNVTNQWAGGMAIYDKYIVQFFTSGRVLVLSKKTLKVVASGAMVGATSNYSMHCNAISFSNTIPQDKSFPYIYISEWTSGSCNCHVETMSISNNSVSMTLVQKISYSGSKFNTSLNWDWSVDAKTGYLWCYGYAASAADRYGAKVALKFPLPNPTSGNVIYTDSDILDEFSFTFAGAQQDVHIENNMMFYEFSYNVTGGYGGILLINLQTKELYTDYIISLESIAREPEGICRDGSTLYVSTHAGDNNFDLSIHTVDLLQSNFDLNSTN